MTLRTLWRIRRELDSLPETLRTLSAYAVLRGDHAQAQDLAELAGQLTKLARPACRREVCTIYEQADDGARPAGVAECIRQVVDAGRASVETAARRRLPPDLVRLLARPGLSLDEVVDLHQRTGAVTAADLAAAVTLPGPTDGPEASLHARIASALPSLRAGERRIPLGRAVSILERVRTHLLQDLPGVVAVEFGGSVRRFEPTVGDLELLVSAVEPSPVLGCVRSRLDDSSTVLHQGLDKLTVSIDRTPVTVRVVPPEQFPFALLHFTGSPLHVRALQQRANAQGLVLTPAGLHAIGHADTRTTDTGYESEAAIYSALGLEWIPPELRGDEGRPEGWPVEPASALVERRHIRGDLHVHTLWSDGRDSVEAVARTALLLGYDYVAITDHSPRSAASRVLTHDRLERQIEEVDRVRGRVPGIRILHGVEVDILPDGSLDFDDEVLARLDVVLASLHEPAGQTSEQLLARYLRAMRHPRVHIITHPANRQVGRHEGYPLDFDALFAEAVRTGTVLEVDGSPIHLDLDGALAGRAARAGVTLSISSDCHDMALLERQMALGLGTARRGAVEARHVINARPLASVLDWFASKPARLEAARDRD